MNLRQATIQPAAPQRIHAGIHHPAPLGHSQQKTRLPHATFATMWRLKVTESKTRRETARLQLAGLACEQRPFPQRSHGTLLQNKGREYTVTSRMEEVRVIPHPKRRATRIKQITEGPQSDPKVSTESYILCFDLTAYLLHHSPPRIKTQPD